MAEPIPPSRHSSGKLNTKVVESFAARGTAGEKRADGWGMYLTITPAGTAAWRVKYRHNGIERLYSIGTYPQISLKEARAERDRVKDYLRAGKDPVQARKLERAEEAASSGQTFASLTGDWLAKQKKDWSAIHYEKSSQAFKRDVLPELGGLPVRDITPAMVARVIEAIVKRGARETAGKILQHIGAVFRLAQARGLRPDNPAEPVHEVLPAKKHNGRMPAVLTFPALGAILRSAEAAHLTPAVRMAHRLCAFSVARIGNVVDAEWSEFDLEADVSTWVIPRRKMKSQDRHHDHKIVLCPIIAAELRQWRGISGSKGYVFPSPAGGKHITRESLEKAYRVTLGLADKHTPHGWRSAFSTLARDEGHERDVVELTLDHIHDNDVVRAYDRGERLQQRIKLMAWWGSQLDQAQRGADVVPMTKGKAA